MPESQKIHKAPEHKAVHTGDSPYIESYTLNYIIMERFDNQDIFIDFDLETFEESDTKGRSGNSPKNHAGNNGRGGRRNGSSRNHKAGKIIVLIQIVLSVVFLIMLFRSSLFQTQIFLVALLTVFVFAGVFMYMQFFAQRLIRVIGIVLSIVTSLALLAGSYYLHRIDQAVSQISGADLMTGVEDSAAAEDGAYNILISGTVADGGDSQTGESDVNIIMTVNTDTKRMLFTMTPCDYYVEIPGISGSELDRLSSAGLYGTEAVADTLEELYGIEIDYCILLDFTSLADVADALGGITVYAEEAFETADGSYSFAEGENDVDGEAALAFLTESCTSSDGAGLRGENQEAVLKGVLKGLASVSVLRDPNGLFDAMTGFAQTNMEKEQLMGLIGGQLINQRGWTYEQQEATGTGDKQVTYSGGSQKLYVIWPDEAVVAAMADRMQLVIDGE